MKIKEHLQQRIKELESLRDQNLANANSCNGAAKELRDLLAKILEEEKNA